MRRRTFLAASVGSIASVAGCLGFGDSDRALPDDPTGQWHQYAFDRRKRGASDITVPDRGNRAWNAGDAQSAEPLIVDGLVISAADSVTALAARTGERKWKGELDGTADDTPAITDEQVVVAADDHLVSLALEDGSEQWSESLPLLANDALTTDGSLVVVPLEARRDAVGLVAYDVADGEQLWTDRTVSASTVAMYENVVYTTGYKQDGDTGVLRALSVTDGSRMWEAELDQPDTSPVATDTGVLVCDGGVLAVHDHDTGERMRQLGTFGDRIYEPPAVADGLAFVGANDSALVAVSIDDGSVQWTSSVGVAARPSLGRETVVVSAESLPDANAAGIAALDRATGELRWEHSLEGFDVYPSTAPTLADGAVYFVSNESSGVSAVGDLPSEEES